MTIDVTSGDVYEIARAQGQGDPVLVGNGSVAVHMKEAFSMRTLDASVEYERGNWLIVNNQKLWRIVLSDETFRMLFGDVRQ